MLSIVWLAVFSLGFLSSERALADDPVFRLGKPAYFGSGCPVENSVKTLVSADGQGFSVHLSQFVAATSNTVTRDRKTCNLLLPLRVKQGVSVAVFKVDYSGHVFVPPAPRPPGSATTATSASGAPASSFAAFQTEYFFAGVQGPLLNQTWSAGTNTSIVPSDQFQLGAQAWSPCGATSTFRINTAITASKANPTDEDTTIAVNTTGLHVTGGIRYFFTTQACNEKAKEKSNGERDD